MYMYRYILLHALGKRISARRMKTLGPLDESLTDAGLRSASEALGNRGPK